MTVYREKSTTSELFYHNSFRFIHSVCYRLSGAIGRKLSDLSTYLKIKLFPKRTRKINIDSKKIVYVGHSYHQKTKSTLFLIDYLKQFFTVEVILDESWDGGIYPDLSFIDESYLGVVFFQNLPDKKQLKSIKNDNLIFFPMYDNVYPLPRSWWNNYYDLKIINFSKTLHEKLLNWGFETIYTQYFPKPSKYMPGNPKEVYFWQRTNKIGIDTIAKLLDESETKIHIHKAIDPNFEFFRPSVDQEKQYKITYSDWYETREDVWDIIKEKGIYVAPRGFEGIGMSFLEAMAMGKAVVSADNPTMNEYIIHNQTGYLFKLNEPKKIDFSTIENVQKNTYNFICEGFENWEIQRKKIIDLILKK
jgi:glycosyltransferase involved in cell wall biosynthesis